MNFKHLFFLLAATTAHAVNDAVIFSGTTTMHGTETYAYLVIQADAATLSGRSFALYRKSGQPDSTSTFERQGVISTVADSRLIASLMHKAQKLGGNMTQLDVQLSTLIGGIAPAVNVSLADKLAVFLAAAETSGPHQRQLAMMARRHPIVALATGRAFADQITSSGIKTYELRLYDVAAAKDLAVVGRVTVNPQNRLVLPAPGVVVEVPDTSVKGNRNISLRWATPAALRDMAPLHDGYDLFRVPRAVAVTQNWLANPPTTVSALVAVPEVKKVNALPLLPPTMLSATQAADTGDTTTIFVNDDGRYIENNVVLEAGDGVVFDSTNSIIFDAGDGVAFDAGAEYLYFVSARDILSRPGLLSPACAVTVQDRYPPQPPMNVRVSNEYRYNGNTQQRKHHFSIEWDAARSHDAGGISAYMIYRWRTPSEIAGKAIQLHATEQKPGMNLVAIVPGNQRRFEDDGSHTPPSWATPSVNTSPSNVTDLGKTYYYTVRAVDDSTARNLSSNSAPAWGVLRDREGPAASAGELLSQNFRPDLDWGSFTLLIRPKLATLPGKLQLAVTSTVNAGLAWAEFRLEDVPDVFIHLGRSSFVSENGTLNVKMDRDVVEYHGFQRLWCRVGTDSGYVTPWVRQSVNFNSPVPLPATRLQARWHVGSLISAPGNGTRHVMVDPSSGLLTDISGTLGPTAGSKEYKIYRRVDLGPQSLIASGVLSNLNAIMWTDANPPGAGATVCYFGQLFDEHGNASPRFQLGQCLDVGDASFLKAPILDQPLATGTANNPRMKLRWCSSRSGVEKFEIWVARKTGARFDPYPTTSIPAAPPQDGNEAADAGSGSPRPISADRVLHPNRLEHLKDAEGLDFSVFETGLTRYIAAAGDPQFEIELPVPRDEEITVMVRAVGPGGFDSRFASAHSNAARIVWGFPSAPPSVDVPWPARPLPPRESFHEGIKAAYLDNPLLLPWRGVGVRIGEYRDLESDAKDTIFDAPSGIATEPKVYYITGQKRAESHIYTLDTLAPTEPDSLYPGMVLPVVMYRVQLPSTKFPEAPGDLVQVTPMIEEIAQDILTNTSNNQPATRVLDPFIACMHNEQTDIPPTAGGFDHTIFLLDRHPLIKGAKYRYYLVRFTPDREIERIIVTNDVTIPE